LANFFFQEIEEFKITAEKDKLANFTIFPFFPSIKGIRINSYESNLQVFFLIFFQKYVLWINGPRRSQTCDFQIRRVKHVIFKLLI